MIAPLEALVAFGPRPVGSDANRKTATWIQAQAIRMGYELQSLPFTCLFWECGPSLARRGDAQTTVFAGPFSPAIFAFRGIPALAVTSSDLRDRVMKLSHTPLDTTDKVDPALLDRTATFMASLIRSLPL